MNERYRTAVAIALWHWSACVVATVCAVHELGWWAGIGLGCALYALLPVVDSK